jgi:hypothetical protein
MSLDVPEILYGVRCPGCSSSTMSTRRRWKPLIGAPPQLSTPCLVLISAGWSPMSGLARNIKSSPAARRPTRRLHRILLRGPAAAMNDASTVDGPGSGTGSDAHVGVGGDVAGGYLRKQRSHVWCRHDRCPGAASGCYGGLGPA